MSIVCSCLWGGGGEGVGGESEGGGGGTCYVDLRPEHNYNPPHHESQVLILGVAPLYKIKHNLQRDARPSYVCSQQGVIRPPPTTTTTTTAHKNVVNINTQGSLRMYLC